MEILFEPNKPMFGKESLLTGFPKYTFVVVCSILEIGNPFTVSLLLYIVPGGTIIVMYSSSVLSKEKMYFYQ